MFSADQTKKRILLHAEIETCSNKHQIYAFSHKHLSGTILMSVCDVDRILVIVLESRRQTPSHTFTCETGSRLDYPLLLSADMVTLPESARLLVAS